MAFIRFNKEICVNGYTKLYIYNINRIETDHTQMCVCSF